MLTFGSQVWGQHINISAKILIKLQDKSIRLINFANYHEPTGKLYKKSQILKLSDNITLQNVLFVHDTLNGILPKALNNNFVYLKDGHNYNKRISSHYQVQVPKGDQQAYSIKSISF